LPHGLFYTYGFEEASGNIPIISFSNQALGKYPVITSVQDRSDVDNVRFGTPLDGKSPIMRMHLWSGYSPSRDAGLDLDIATHEFTHGV
ncbi:hypothetical protein EC988_006619, partial [Linderina pennispora]